MGKLTVGNFTGTVLFVDIKNFLSISEILTPKDVRKFILKAIDPISRSIKQHGGYICQIQGDAILAVFGLMNEQRKHAMKAVECAMDIKRVLDGINPIIIADLCIPLSVRIGICSGEMYSCYIKAVDYKEYTVLGKTVNLAARYQQLNKHYDTNILIDEAVFAYIKKTIATRKLDKINIEGCSEAVTLYEVLFLRKKPNKKNMRKRIQYSRGLVNYMRNEWDKAIECFQYVSQDNVYGKMLKRCKEFKETLSCQKKDGTNS